MTLVMVHAWNRRRGLTMWLFLLGSQNFFITVKQLVTATCYRLSLCEVIILLLWQSDTQIIQRMCLFNNRGSQQFCRKAPCSCSLNTTWQFCYCCQLLPWDASKSLCYLHRLPQSLLHSWCFWFLHFHWQNSFLKLGTPYSNGVQSLPNMIHESLGHFIPGLLDVLDDRHVHRLLPACVFSPVHWSLWWLNESCT